MSQSNHAVILLHEGPKILFVKRSATKKFLPNAWSFASGTMKKGETPEATVLREAKEELGLDATIEKELFVVDLSLPDKEVSLHFILCKNPSNQQIVFDQTEIQDYQFLTFEEFFKKYQDNEIDYGPRYLRNRPELWRGVI